MNIALINPHPSTYPPLGLVTIASSLIAEGYTVKIYEGFPKNIGNPDLIGIGGLTLWFNEIKQLLNQLPQDVPVVLGGPCVTSNPELFQSLDVDYAIMGEGEISVCELAKKLEEGEKPNGIKGLLEKGQRNFVPRPFIDLNTKPFPAWDLLPNLDYRAGLGVETSRGCPFNCVFCTAPFISGRVWRGRKVSSVINEILFIYSRFNARKIYFAEDNCTANPKRWRQLVHELAKLDLPIEFHVLEGIQAHNLNFATLELMKKAGFKHIYIGAESGNQRVLDKVIDKGGLTVRQIERVVRDCGLLNIKISCFFVIGILGETIEEMKQTVAFAQYLRELGAESCEIRNCLPVPNTRLWQIAEKGGNLLITKEQAQDHKLLHSGKHFIISKEWTPQQVEELTRLGQKQESEHYKRKNKFKPLFRPLTLLPTQLKHFGKKVFHK